MYSGNESGEEGAGITFLAGQVTFCIILVRLETAKSMSSNVFNFMLKLFFVLTNSRHLE